MKRILAMVISILMMAAVFSGCGSKKIDSDAAKVADQGVSTTDQQETQADEGQASQFPLKLKDASGFEMTIEKQPEAITSLTLGTDEVLLSLVDSSRIKSLTSYSDDPAISNVVDKAKEVKERAASEAEKVIALKPDLVFVDTWSKPEFVQQLRDSGIAVYVFKTPSNLEEQKAMVKEIANVVGENAKGEELVAWMDAKLKEVDDKLSALKPEEKLTVIDYGEMGSSGKGTNFDAVVTRAGLENVVATKAGIEGWQMMSKEKIVEINPDIMIVPSWYYDQKNTLESFTGDIKADKSLSTVNAVKNDKLIAIPNPHISAISHYVVLGVEDVAKAAYPDLFK